jgi:hypothetical protein
MTARVSALLLAATMLLLAACGGDSAGGASEVPEGYQLIDHPDVVLAIPTGWTLVDIDASEVQGSNVAQYDSPESPALTMLLWRWGQPAEPGDVVLATGVVVARRELNPGFKYLANEPVEVSGADDAHLKQVQWESGPTTVYQTVVAARLGEKAVVVTFAGTGEHPPDEAVEVALDTMRLR